MSEGMIRVLGLGPGNPRLLPALVIDALRDSDMIIGYSRYLHQIDGLFPHIPRLASGMRHEIERAEYAVRLAKEGRRVAVVSGGDAGIYGMAGLILETLEKEHLNGIDVEILPGISALNAAAALLGAPLMTDFAVISLSDLLIPLDCILKRLEAALRADFVICLYNPRSHQRTLPFERAYQMMLELAGSQRPVGIVWSAYRPEQRILITTLQHLPSAEVGMDTILIVGNSQTRVLDGRLVTSRGYSL